MEKLEFPEIPNAKKFETSVPYIVHESDMARLAHTNELLLKVNHRQHIVIISLIVLIWAMIVAFFIYESQWETVTEEYTSSADGDGVAILNGSGEVNYGESKLQEDSQN